MPRSPERPTRGLRLPAPRQIQGDGKGQESGLFDGGSFWGRLPAPASRGCWKEARNQGGCGVRSARPRRREGANSPPCTAARAAQVIFLRRGRGRGAARGGLAGGGAWREGAGPHPLATAARGRLGPGGRTGSCIGGRAQVTSRSGRWKRCGWGAGGSGSGGQASLLPAALQWAEGGPARTRPRLRQRGREPGAGIAIDAWGREP